MTGSEGVCLRRDGRGDEKFFVIMFTFLEVEGYGDVVSQIDMDDAIVCLL